MPPLSVLVVEDDAALRKLFIALLTRRGFIVDCACDGSEALSRLAHTSYSVMILDLMMPVANGFDVLARLCEEKPALLRRTIVASSASERDLARLDRSTVFAVLRKPFDIDVLVGTIHACAGDLDGPAQKFAAALPDLRRVFSSAPAGEKELMLRRELRNVVGELGDVLSNAGTNTLDGRRAAKLDGLAQAAYEIAGGRTTQVRREH